MRHLVKERFGDRAAGPTPTKPPDRPGWSAACGTGVRRQATPPMRWRSDLPSPSIGATDKRVEAELWIRQVKRRRGYRRRRLRRCRCRRRFGAIWFRQSRARPTDTASWRRAIRVMCWIRHHRARRWRFRALRLPRDRRARMVAFSGDGMGEGLFYAAPGWRCRSSRRCRPGRGSLRRPSRAPDRATLSRSGGRWTTKLAAAGSATELKEHGQASSVWAPLGTGAEAPVGLINEDGGLGPGNLGLQARRRRFGRGWGARDAELGCRGQFMPWFRGRAGRRLAPR